MLYLTQEMFRMINPMVSLVNAVVIVLGIFASYAVVTYCFMNREIKH
jgi:hypothetical protein